MTPSFYSDLDYFSVSVVYHPDPVLGPEDSESDLPILTPGTRISQRL